MSNELTASTKENTISSREVAEMMEIRHDHMLDKIDKINQVLFKDIPTKDIQCMIDTMNKMNEKIEGAK